MPKKHTNIQMRFIFWGLIIFALNVINVGDVRANLPTQDTPDELTQPDASQQPEIPGLAEAPAEDAANIYEEEASLRPGAPVKKKKKGGGGSCLQRVASVPGISSGEAACLSKLFMAEASCDPTKIHPIWVWKGKGKHRRKVRNNPNAGFGLCAIETDRGLRAAAGRGPHCMKSTRTQSSFAEQTLCCLDISRKHGSAYFGTMQTGKAYKCR